MKISKFKIITDSGISNQHFKFVVNMFSLDVFFSLGGTIADLQDNTQRAVGSLLLVGVLQIRAELQEHDAHLSPGDNLTNNFSGNLKKARSFHKCF